MRSPALSLGTRVAVETAAVGQHSEKGAEKEKEGEGLGKTGLRWWQLS